MYAAGAKGHFDTLSHHPYGITSREFKSNGWALMNGDVVTPPPGEKTLKQIMQEYGDGDKKIWASEVGREAMYQGLDEMQQATVIKTLLEQHAKTGEGPMILYQAQNDRAPYVPGIVSRDADGDGKLAVNIDTDGDGKADANLDADGNGIPTVPSCVVVFVGEQATVGDASVRPYPSQIGHPVTDSQRRATAFGTAIPPASEIRKFEKSSPRNTSWATSMS